MQVGQETRPTRKERARGVGRRSAIVTGVAVLAVVVTAGAGGFGPSPTAGAAGTTSGPVATATTIVGAGTPGASGSASAVAAPVTVSAPTTTLSASAGASTTSTTNAGRATASLPVTTPGSTPTTSPATGTTSSRSAPTAPVPTTVAAVAGTSVSRQLLASVNDTCTHPATPALQEYLDSLPAGSTFTPASTACYLVPDGIVLSQPISIVGGTFYDPTAVSHTAHRLDGRIYNVGLEPIILIQDTSDVSLSSVTVLGVNTLGTYHSLLVGQAGVKIESSTGVTLTGVTARNTFGDGLELMADLSDRIGTPVSGLTVNGFTTIDAGRQGVTVGEVENSTLNDVDIVTPADSGFDFETDTPGLGSGYLTISNCQNDKNFNLIETFNGPVTVTDCTGFQEVRLWSPNSSSPITFQGGSMTCKRSSPQPCVSQTGGVMTFDGVTIGRLAGTGTVRTPAWGVDTDGTLDFINSPIPDPFGTATPGSTVTFST